MAKPRGVFICYRREDTGLAARALYQHLREAFPNRPVFIDVDSVAHGDDFVEAIRQAITESATVFVLIGHEWLERQLAEGPRLFQPDDYVRLEIRLALQSKAKVVPVFVEGAKAPRDTELPDDVRALAYRNGAPLRTADFDTDVARLVAIIGARRSRWTRAMGLLGAGAAGLAAALIASRTTSSEGEMPALAEPAPATSELTRADQAEAQGETAITRPAAVPTSRAVRPYEMADCEVRSANFGDWRAPVDVVAAAAARLAGELCYNYWELDPRRFATTFQSCAAASRSSTIQFQVVQPNGGCTVTFRTASLRERRWIWVRSLYLRGAQLGDQVDILEVTGQDFVDYARSWQCGMGRDDATRSSAPTSASPAGLLSRQMHTDWPALPPVLRGFLCAGELIGEDLSAP